MGCRWVLVGTFRRFGAALRVSAQVVEAVTGRSIVAETMDGTLDQIFDIQDRIVAVTRSSLAVETAAEQGQQRTTLSAYECYARGQRLVTKLEKGSFDQALQFFEEAVQQDPKHAKALTGLANIYALRHTYTTDVADLETAMAYARRAIDADEMLAESHVWLGYALARSGRLDEAETSLRRARELNDSAFFGFYFGAAVVAQLWWILGSVHLVLGHLAEALSSFARTAQRNLDPDAVHPVPGIDGYRGECLRRMGRVDEARKRCLDALQEVERTDFMYRDTHRVVALVTLGRVAAAQADLEAARAAFQQALAHMKGRPQLTAGGRLTIQALAGLAHVNNDPQTYEAACRLRDRRSEFNFNWVPLCDDAMTYLDLARAARTLGKTEDTQAFLERARGAGWVDPPESHW